MSYSPGTSMVTAPVSIYDLQRCVTVSLQRTNTSTGQVESMTANDVGVLCAANIGDTIPASDGKGNWTVTYRVAINKWAKYKPLKFAKIEQLNATNMISANYGIIDIPTWTRMDYMATFLFSASRASLSQTYWPECDRTRTPSPALADEYWAYQRPTGGASSPYRLTDFKDYYHLAEAPVGNMESSAINISPEGVLQIMFPKGPVDNQYALLLEDLTYPGTMNQTIANMYFGVLMRKTSGGTTYASLMMSNGSYVKIGDVSSARYFVVEIQLTESQASLAGTWNIYPIISKDTFPQMTTTMSTTTGKYIVPLPYHSQNITIAIQYAKAEITNVVAIRSENPSNRHNTAYFTLTLKNEESVSRNYRIIVTLCNSNGDTIETFADNPRSFTDTIPGNSSAYTKTVSIDISSMSANQQANLYYKIKTEIDLSYQPNIKFREESNWSLHGPIPEGSLPQN